MSGRPALSAPCTFEGCDGHAVRVLETRKTIGGETYRRHLGSCGHRFTSHKGGPRAPRARNNAQPRDPVPIMPVLTEWRPYPFAEALQ
jgi:hypothetical protein